jgi:CheY-like chemotaxis protein
MLAVTDTGTGMDKETQSHIFEPFFTTKDPSKGTGLGLSIVYGGVKQSGGYTCVYSELGRGTTFKVYLPRVEKPVQTLAPHKVRRALGGPETILLVEDEVAVQSVIRDFLQSIGYSVLIADGPAEAIAISKRHASPIHLLLTDVVMPAMNGCQLAAQVEHPNLKVLYMSGYTHNAITCIEKLQGDQAFLQKPFALDILARRIDELLHRPGRKEVQSVLPFHDAAIGANA